MTPAGLCGQLADFLVDYTGKEYTALSEFRTSMKAASRALDDVTGVHVTADKVTGSWCLGTKTNSCELFSAENETGGVYGDALFLMNWCGHHVWSSVMLAFVYTSLILIISYLVKRFKKSVQRCGRQDADTIYGQLPVRYHPALPPGDRQKSAENSNQHLHLHGDSVQSYYDTIARNRGDRT